MSKEIIISLKKIGLTEYEAKVYLVVLNLGQSTAREIGETADIPMSRVYSVLKSLVERGFASIIDGTPTYYVPLDPDSVFTAIREEYCEQINLLRKNLNNYYYEINTSSPFWAIYNDRGIEIMIKNLISGAQKEIIVMVTYPQHLRPHLPLLIGARKRVDLFTFVPDKTPFAGMGLRIYKMSEELVNFFYEMYCAQVSMHTCIKSMQYDSHEDEYFYLIDGIKACSMGYQNGVRCATVIRIPTFCYLFRKMISVYDPRIGMIS